MLDAQDMVFLSKLPIFGGLSSEVMARVGALARRVDYERPTVICAEGEPAREMFVVLEGQLEVSKRGRSGTEARIAVLKGGDVAGEMALIDIQPRSAALRALGPASLAVLSHGDLATLYREDRDAYTMFVLNIAREISRRLRRVDGLLADILIDVQEVWADALTRAGTSQGPR